MKKIFLDKQTKKVVTVYYKSQLPRSFSKMLDLVVIKSKELYEQHRKQYGNKILCLDY